MNKNKQRVSSVFDQFDVKVVCLCGNRYKLHAKVDHPCKYYTFGTADDAYTASVMIKKIKGDEIEAKKEKDPLCVKCDPDKRAACIYDLNIDICQRKDEKNELLPLCSQCDPEIKKACRYNPKICGSLKF